jgi:hypothetical protein
MDEKMLKPYKSLFKESNNDVGYYEYEFDLNNKKFKKIGHGVTSEYNINSALDYDKQAFLSSIKNNKIIQKISINMDPHKYLEILLKLKSKFS